MERANSKLEDILNAATVQFLEHGLRKATMQAIADEAKVSKRTLYKYFPNKEELYEKILDEMFAQIEQNISNTPDFDRPFEQMLEEIIISRIRLMRNERMIQLSRLVMSESLKSNPRTCQTHEKFLHIEKRFMDWAEEAQKRGYLTTEVTPFVILQQFHALLSGSVFYPVLLGKIPKLTDADAETFTQIVKRTMLKAFGTNEFQS